MACWDVWPSSRSSGPRKESKKSRKSVSVRLTMARTVSRTSSFTSVLKTIGGAPCARAAALIFRAVRFALSTEETNGTVIFVKSRASNWAIRLWPSVSAVTPEWSETKKTVRWVIVR